MKIAATIFCSGDQEKKVIYISKKPIFGASGTFSNQLALVVNHVFCLTFLYYCRYTAACSKLLVQFKVNQLYM